MKNKKLRSLTMARIANTQQTSYKQSYGANSTKIPTRQEKCEGQVNPYQYIKIQSVDEVLDMSISYWNTDKIMIVLKKEYLDMKPSVYMYFIPPDIIITNGKWVFDIDCKNDDGSGEEGEEENEGDPCCSYTIDALMVSAVQIDNRDPNIILFHNNYEDEDHKFYSYSGSNYDIFLRLEIPYSSDLTYGVYIKAKTLKEKL